MTSIKRLIVVVGPTGSGKSDLSIEIAKALHAPIISTDSRQFYRGLAIGSAQPTAQQLAEAEHHFIACRDITEDFNCGAYEKEALALLDRLFKQSDNVVAVGGSGLYIKALCEGLDELPDCDPELRSALRKRLTSEGLAPLLEELKLLDPTYYEIVDRQNPSRVLRALELCIQSGKPYSSLRGKERAVRDFQIIKVGINMPREQLYDRINRRVEIMVGDGLIDEARAMLPYRKLNALQTVGYRELFDYFDGSISLQEAIELIQRNSRRYAKRQMTWFGRDERIKWFESGDVEPILNYIEINFASHE
ncbi:MAG: tRNA (adenosine(37)-N6)-dimethylallyltransferase MiaA [Rikenellaceae bacterium]